MTQSGQGGEPWGPPPGHVLGPGYEGPGAPHGQGYPPLPDAVTQYIPPVPGANDGDAATQYIPPVAGANAGEAATQYIPPVPAASADDAATQYIPPVPGGAAADYDGLFRDSAGGHTQVLPPIAEPVAPGPYGRGRPQPGAGVRQPHQQPQPQPFTPYPEEDVSRRPSAPVIAAAVFGLAVIGLGVGTLLGDDAPARNDDPAAVAATPTPGPSSSAAGETPVDPARSQAVQLDKLLADSNDSRSSVLQAVEHIKSCKNLDDAASDLRDAARQREEMVTRLGELKIDKLKDSAQLSAALTKGWQSSAAADKHYAAWADELDGKKKDCKDGHAKPSGHAVDGNKASAEATRAKETAATLWNRIATQYGLTKRDKSQL
ncbi:hypothetical protein [Streptomyces antimicrobicus]|uniref:Uncharacterized protein n=1 Tax=Streptomyces antimicrobicus TaxID=2883108 RepID=A0ABS8B134_9ACTN|nr:hypothetical protein [Streptomyces antimicrobicus]MCB5178320.1 hypothetical protein [Streptomyces antimicrobicus]